MLGRELYGIYEEANRCIVVRRQELPVEVTTSLTALGATMDIFQHRYYRLNKQCMMLIGQWPYQSARDRRTMLSVVICVAVTRLPPLLLALVKFRDDWNIVIECIIAFLFAAVGIMKLIVMMWNSQKTLKLLNGISTNWQVWARSQEVNILHEYAEQGEKMTIVYTATIYTTIILYMTQPIIPKIIDVILKNGTELGKLPYPVDYYFFDAQKYYYLVMLHFYIGASTAAIPLVASDTMLIIYVQHVCGVLAALGHKLEQIGNSDPSVENVVHLSSLVNRHNYAIEYANLIESTNMWNFFILIGIGIILINVLGVQILLRTNDPESTIRYIAFVLSLLLVFYVDCYISQILIDHSSNLGFYIYNSRWYRLLPKDQKVLQLMTIRCRVPCRLTAGKMLMMSLSNFGLTVRTAMSYLMVIRPK